MGFGKTYSYADDKKTPFAYNESAVCQLHRKAKGGHYMSVSSFMGYLKGKSSLMIYEKYPELKYKYRNREFWCRGYYVDTVGKNAKVQTIVRRLTALS